VDTTVRRAAGIGLLSLVGGRMLNTNACKSHARSGTDPAHLMRLAEYIEALALKYAQSGGETSHLVRLLLL